MIRYLAVMKDSGIFLANAGQINEFLDKGFDIYEVYEDNSKKLLYPGTNRNRQEVTKNEQSI